MSQQDAMHERMVQIRGQRRRPTSTTPDTRLAKSEVASRVMGWVGSMVEPFVAGDAALEVQSRDATQIFIGYALLSVGVLRMRTVPDGMVLELHDGVSVLHTLPVDESTTRDTVERWTQSALLAWYEQLF